MIKVKEPIEVKIEFDADGNSKTSIHYETTCEYGSLGRKGITVDEPITMNDIKEGKLDKAWAIAKAQAHEDTLVVKEK
jgi:hypothetical protein